MKNRVREMRKELKMTVPQLSERLETTPRNLRWIEQGHHLTLEMALKISRIFNVSIEELIMPDSINSDSSKLPVESLENPVERAM